MKIRQFNESYLVCASKCFEHLPFSFSKSERKFIINKFIFQVFLQWKRFSNGPQCEVVARLKSRSKKCPNRLRRREWPMPKPSSRDELQEWSRRIGIRELSRRIGIRRKICPRVATNGKVISHFYKSWNQLVRSYY